MTENVAAKTKRPVWVIWMHVAGIAYPVALWLIVLAFITGPSQFAIAGAVALTVGTFAFIGGFVRWLSTK